MFRAYFLPVGLLLVSSIGVAQQYTISTIAGGAPTPTPATAAHASVGDPARVAVDTAGNLYFSSNHSVYKVDVNGNLTRVAGNGRSGNSGDNGSATAAQLETPDGIAVDASGNIYVADRDANVVRLITMQGIITTAAGNGTAGYTGDGGIATGAQLNAPLGLALDGQGNLYIADSKNNAVRRVGAGGIISTVAGNGGPGFGGDGGQAPLAFLNTPESVAVDAAGNLYIADTFNDRVRLVANGVISTVAGNGIDSFAGDGAAAATAGLFLPTAVTVDKSGNLFIADFGNSRIREVTQGNIQTVVGSAKDAVVADDELATASRLNGPTGVAVDGNGVIYFAEGSIGTGSGLVTGDYRVWKVTAGVVFTAAGNGIQSYSGDGGPATTAQLGAPSSVASDSSGNLYIADLMNHRVRLLAPNGTITTVAGNGKAGFSGDGGPAVNAQLNAPEGVAVDSAGNLYISDTKNSRIRKVSPAGTITTLAGNGNAAFLGDGGPATAAAIHSPQGMAVDNAGNLYFADTLDHRVREILVNGTIVTVAGNGQPAYSGDGGPAAAAALNAPSGLAIDKTGNLYIADEGNGRIRMVNPSGKITTVAGGGSSVALGDGGAATAAWLLHPEGVAVDAAGNLYITESVPNGDQLTDPTLVQDGSGGSSVAGPDNRVRAVLTTGVITTIAGNGNCCYMGDGGSAANAQVNAPWGIAIDQSGRVYVADSGNNAVRLIQGATPTVNPAIAAVVNAASNALGAVAAGEVVVLYGTGLGPAQLVQAQSGGTPPTQLDGVSVLFNGTAAQLLYVSSTQVSAIVPAVTGTNVQIVAEFQGVGSPAVSVALTPAAPALFTVSPTGSGQAVAVNPDGTPNGPDHPVAEGSVISLYLNGTSAEWFTGTYSVQIAGLPASSSSPVTPVSVPVGVTAISVQVPHGIPPGIAQVVVQASGAASPPVTIVVSGN